MLSKKNDNSKAMPNLNSFLTSFKNIASGEDQGEYICNDDEETIIIDEEVQTLFLDSEFTSDEIDKMVANLKNKKACGQDKILNEYICATYDKLKPMYIALFNRVLEEGIVPETWLNGMILPIYKSKGDRNDPDNYRGITLLSCLGKLFTSVINERLNKYADKISLINENQAGFRNKYSTTDHIFLFKT